MGNCFERSRGRRRGGSGDVGADAAHCAAENKRAAFAEAAAAAEEEEMKQQKGEKVTEVKIRITRKQLEELLRLLEEGKDGGDAVVSELLCMSSSCNFRHRPEQWRPSLQVIPE